MSSQPKIIKFGWDFTKLYQFNIKQMEMFSFLGHPVCIMLFRYYDSAASRFGSEVNCKARTSDKSIGCLRDISDQPTWCILVNRWNVKKSHNEFNIKKLIVFIKERLIQFKNIQQSYKIIEWL